MPSKPWDPRDPLPAKPNTEKLVLGALQLGIVDLGYVASVLSVSVFSVEDHRTIYRRMLEVHAREERIDRVIVANELDKHGELKKITLGYPPRSASGMPKMPSTLALPLRIMSRERGL
jgi:replicative DNA helicase